MVAMVKDPAMRTEFFNEFSVPIETALHLELSEYSAHTAFGKSGKWIARKFRDFNPLTYQQQFLRKALAHREAIELSKAVKNFSKLDKVQRMTLERFGITEDIAKVIDEHAVKNVYGAPMVFSDQLYAVPDKIVKNLEAFKHLKTMENKKEALVKLVDNYFYQRNRTGVPLKGERVTALLSGGDRGTISKEVMNFLIPLKGIVAAIFEESVNIYKTQSQNGAKGKLRMAEHTAFMLGAGYAVAMLQDLRDGKTPPDPTAPQTMKRAVLSSGMLGPMADFIIDTNYLNDSKTFSDKVLSGFSNPTTQLLSEMGNAVFDSKKGIVGFVKNVEAGDEQKYGDQLMSVSKNIPGQNLPQTFILMKLIFGDTLQKATNKNYHNNQFKKMHSGSGKLWRQRRITDIIN
jgi:hypothetical protein